MKRAFAALILTLVIGGLAVAQRSVPRFSQYKVTVEKPRVSGINFKKSPGASTYRTRLTHAMRGGVNFAGHYILTGWGCGTGCTNGGIIEARTGNVIWPEEFMNIDATYRDGYSDEQLEFKKNSRLLVIHGRPGSRNETPNQKPGDYYFEWRNNRFRPLRFVAVPTT